MAIIVRWSGTIFPPKGALPVPAPLGGLRMDQRGVGRNQVLLAVADPAVILAPVHFTGIGSEIWAGDMMVNAGFEKPQRHPAP